MMTPDDLRDIARVIGGEPEAYRSNKESHRTASMIRARLLSEAARREAEAKPNGPLTGIEAGPDAVHPKPPVEGPGSAAAYYTDTFVCPPDTNADHWAWFLSERSPEYAAVRICEMIERSNESRRALREELAKALANAKPEVAPDDEALLDAFFDEAKHKGDYGTARLALRRHIAELRSDNAQLQYALEQSEMRYSEKESALVACMAGKVPEGSVVLPKQAIEALYMRLWARHEHLDDGPPDFEPVRQPWTPDDDAALKAVAKYLFAAPEAPR